MIAIFKSKYFVFNHRIGCIPYSSLPIILGASQLSEYGGKYIVFYIICRVGSTYPHVSVFHKSHGEQGCLCVNSSDYSILIETTKFVQQFSRERVTNIYTKTHTHSPLLQARVLYYTDSKGSVGQNFTHFSTQVYRSHPYLCTVA